MRLALLLLLLLLSACAAVQPARAPQRDSIGVSELEIHANPSVFSGERLPRIEVHRPAGKEGRLERYSVKTTFYDSEFVPVTVAKTPGRYGAIVEITTESSRVLRRFLTLYRAQGRIDWDGIRIAMKPVFPREFGVDPSAVEDQQEAIGESFKEIMRQSTERMTDAAVMLAGLHEAKRATPFTAREGFVALDQKWWYELKRRTETLGLPYLIHLPKDYGAPADADKHPLIIFLHGSGEAGDGGKDLHKVEGNGLARMLKTETELPADFPFIVLIPQCPPDQPWSPYELVALLDEIQSKYRVDPDRIYLTGLSLGGYGVWDTAIAFPDRFAAIAPVSGGGDPADVARIKNVPAWIFHGENDPTVPVGEAKRMIEALKKIGGHVRATIYANTGHNAWTPAYRTGELYEWFLRQRRGRPAE